MNRNYASLLFFAAAVFFAGCDGDPGTAGSPGLPVLPAVRSPRDRQALPVGRSRRSGRGDRLYGLRALRDGRPEYVEPRAVNDLSFVRHRERERVSMSTFDLRVSRLGRRRVGAAASSAASRCSSRIAQSQRRSCRPIRTRFSRSWRRAPVRLGGDRGAARRARAANRLPRLQERDRGANRRTIPRAVPRAGRSAPRRLWPSASSSRGAPRRSADLDRSAARRDRAAHASVRRRAAELERLSGARPATVRPGSRSPRSISHAATTPRAAPRAAGSCCSKTPSWPEAVSRPRAP